jgi:hypothetical protein
MRAPHLQSRALLLFALAATILMVIEARKHGVKFVWLYIAGGLAIAISVTFSPVSDRPRITHGHIRRAPP